MCIRAHRIPFPVRCCLADACVPSTPPALSASRPASPRPGRTTGTPLAASNWCGAFWDNARQPTARSENRVEYSTALHPIHVKLTIEQTSNSAPLYVCPTHRCSMVLCLWWQESGRGRAATTRARHTHTSRRVHSCPIAARLVGRSSSPRSSTRASSRARVGPVLRTSCPRSQSESHAARTQHPPCGGTGPTRSPRAHHVARPSACSPQPPRHLRSLSRCHPYVSPRPVRLSTQPCRPLDGGGRDAPPFAATLLLSRVLCAAP